MTAKDVRDRLKGVFGFPVTPLKKDLSLDLAALERNVAEMVKYPFCAIVAAGGTGELYSLTVEEIEQVVREKWKTMDIAGENADEISGTGDDGLFVVRLTGSRVTSSEGLAVK